MHGNNSATVFYRFCASALALISLSLCGCSAHKGKPLEKQSVKELLDDLAKQPDDNTRIAIVRQLGKRGDPQATQAVIDALQDRADRVRAAAAGALAGSTDARVPDTLFGVTKDLAQDRTVRYAAAKSLASLMDVRAAEPLVYYLKYSPSDAAAALVGLGNLAIPELIDALRTPQMSEEAAKVLIAMGSLGVPALTELLRSRFKYERLAAARILPEIEDPRGDEALQQALQPGDLELADAAYRFLIRQGKPESEERLIQVLAGFGSLGMAEDFATSGNPRLAKAAQDWAKKQMRPLQGRTSELDPVYWGGEDASTIRLGLYHFDGSLKNTSGVSPVKSNGASFVPGKWGSALSVAVGGTVVYPASGNLDFHEGTIEMWISPTMDTADPIFTKHNHALLLYRAKDEDQFVFSHSIYGGFYAGTVVKGAFHGTGGGSLQGWKPGAWHHVAFTYSARKSRQRFYVDGVMTGDIRGPLPAPAEGAEGFTAGSDPWGTGTSFLVDEMLIVKGEKSSGQIRNDAARAEPFPDR